MSDNEPIPSLAEAMAEIRRLRIDCEALDAIVKHERGITESLRARIAELEAAAALQHGTLAPPAEDEPARFTHTVPPSAPPHNERPSIGIDDE